MAKEFERAGIPTALISTLVPVAQSIGPYRVVAGKAIPHPVGDPSLPRDEERRLRRSLVQLALDALQTETPEPIVLRLDGA